VNGMVQHMDSWYELYNVQEGDALYLPADKRIKIW
jgi:putative endopeptidase